jgi:hypothetical protein
VRKPLRFKERDVTRATKAVRAAGLDIDRVVIERTGRSRGASEKKVAPMETESSKSEGHEQIVL